MGVGSAKKQVLICNPPLIWHMLWLSIEEGLPELNSTIVLSRKDRIGVIMQVKKSTVSDEDFTEREKNYWLKTEAFDSSNCCFSRNHWTRLS